ncbi:MAG: GtrA family protein [Flavobacteriales bacterium]|nr:GtrA family protein [Flavobacteriales bacterium]
MKALLRAQLSAAAATAFDLATTVALAGGVGIAAPVAGAAGSVVGGGINFTLNRRWAYDAASRGWRRQAMRYLLVWCGHVVLSYGLLRLGVDVIGWHYLPVKLAVMALLAVGWNHLLHRRYVFAG